MSAPSPSKEIPPLALLVGGLATRLGPLTARLPKSMVPVAGEPFIAHQLRLLVRHGVRNVVVCCGHLADQIESFVGDGRQFGCRVVYSYDGPTPLCTGGAIRKALSLLGPVFWVMYGDSYLTTPFIPVLEAFQRSGHAALMTVYENRGRWDTSNVLFQDSKVVCYDKRRPLPGMQHIDYGLSIFSAEVFEEWPDASAFDLADLQSSIAANRSLAGYEVRERFYEIGSLSGLHETDSVLTESLRGVLA